MNGLFRDCAAKSIAACVGGAAVNYAVGGWSPVLGALATLVVVDTVTGLLKAWKANQVKSDGLKAGAIKILLYGSLVVVGHQIGAVSDSLKWARDAIVLYLSLTEAISIVENAQSLGVNLPPFVLSALRLEQGKIEKEEPVETDKKGV